MDTSQRTKQLEAVTTEALENLTVELSKGHSQNFIELLAFFSKLHSYSIRNCILIRAQLPTATRCASLKRWGKLGCQVARGQRAIWVFQPILRKVEKDGQEEEKLLGFRPTPVFDVSQLTPESQAKIPSHAIVLPDDANDLWSLLVERCKVRNLTVTEQRMPVGALGSCTQDGQIKIEERQDSRSKALILAHELAHYYGHWKPEAAALTRAECEIQAESTSVVIGSMLGFEHPAARDYLLAYNGTPEQLWMHFRAIKRLVVLVADVFDLGAKQAEASVAA